MVNGVAAEMVKSVAGLLLRYTSVPFLRVSQLSVGVVSVLLMSIISESAWEEPLSMVRLLKIVDGVPLVFLM